MDVDGAAEDGYFRAPPISSDVDTSATFNLSTVYFPKEGDHVLGVIVSKNLDFYTLDIGGLCEAVLPAVDGFRGATKRNRPNLHEGDVVFCQVTREYPARELPTEVSCINAGDMKQWTTKETYFGQLEDGFMFTVPIPYSYCLSGDRCYVLEKCAARFKYEIAIGLNGRVWVRSANASDTLHIARYIRMCFGLTLPQMEALFTYLDNSP
ncbi:Exosome complex component RRP40 [Babesia bigemina]|uniref:Ribosomal RNA-processing protein 40 n=1 Tax=Babesia bigemina TaxID=5866 RepID=A0A061DD99_BABBI|nr:Exosome complex component RRP40 [Babesia bigemina]CDR97214.1 Exosome complex component RRP40 [Babesia bigemina]|eukprot:XP_012769400.1 Exosome complex component RRP40 [Babesia bigemina]